MKGKWWHYQLFYWSLIALGIAIINDTPRFVIWTVGAVGLTCYELWKEENHD